MIEISGTALQKLQAALSAVWREHRDGSWEQYRGRHECNIRKILEDEYPGLRLESKWGSIRDAIEEVWEHAYSADHAIRNIRSILSM